MHNEKLYTLLQAPIVTEKSSRLGEELKQFVFKVDLSAPPPPKWGKITNIVLIVINIIYIIKLLYENTCF